ncbi:hypothetical protein GCM10027168_63490 [Streptomyces capparidis]
MGGGGRRGRGRQGRRADLPARRRGWLKIRSRHTTEALIGAITGHPTHPTTLLLGRWDTVGLLRLVARTTPLTDTVAGDVARVLAPAGPSHPWCGMRITGRWGSREPLAFQCVEPAAVVEFSGDTAVDTGRWRHPVHALRLRPGPAVRGLARLGHHDGHQNAEQRGRTRMCRSDQAR